MMLAIVIFMLVVGAIYSTWSLIIRSSFIGQEAAAQVQRQRIAIRTITDALTCIQSVQSSLQYYSFNVQNGSEPLLGFTARLPDFYPRNGKFGDATLRRLTFALEPGPESEGDLVLRQQPLLMDMDTDEKAYPLVLARGVSAFNIECWDTNALDWVTEWDNTNYIPPMVRISLTLGGKTKSYVSGVTAPVTTIFGEIAVPSTTLPNVVQVPRQGGPGGVVPGRGGAGGALPLPGGGNLIPGGGRGGVLPNLPK